jgi:ankyrin repeat protein
LACALLIATLLAGCGKEASRTRSPKNVTTREGKDNQSVSSNAEAASHPDKGKSAAAAATTEAKEPAVSAANSQLCEACRNNKLPEVREALAKGADVNARDENGSAAIMLAAFDGHTEIVRLLLEHGADVNALDSSGRTALMYAASGPNQETVQVLLVNGAKVNLRDREEMYTALMFAAAEGQAENVQLLLAHGSDASLVDIDGDTAANFARKNGHTKVVELLK